MVCLEQGKSQQQRHQQLQPQGTVCLVGEAVEGLGEVSCMQRLRGQGVFPMSKSLLGNTGSSLRMRRISMCDKAELQCEPDTVGHRAPSPSRDWHERGSSRSRHKLRPVSGLDRKWCSPLHTWHPCMPLLATWPSPSSQRRKSKLRPEHTTWRSTRLSYDMFARDRSRFTPGSRSRFLRCSIVSSSTPRHRPLGRAAQCFDGRRGSGCPSHDACQAGTRLFRSRP
jgi:hypothetical protein